VDRGNGAGLSDRWADIGTDQAVGLLAIQLWQLELPFRRPVLTAKGPVTSRPLVLVQVVAESGGALVEGWGECAALADTTFDDEDAPRSFGLLRIALIPALLDLAPVAGDRLPRPVDLDVIRQAAPDAVLAYAAVEMAVADAHLRAAQLSLAAVLGVPDEPVDLGAVVGRPATVDELVAEVGALVELGYRRVKVKIGPGWDVAPLRALREAFPSLGLQADANGSYGVGDVDHLADLDRIGLLCLEQPFDRQDLVSHERLGAVMGTPICLDESIDGVRSVKRALASRAATAVCVKPSRLGGIGSALEVIEGCTADGVPLWMGGMFESSYARGVNLTLAGLPGFTWPGDLSPASTYLVDDLVEPALTGRFGPDRYLAAVPPRQGGMGPTPDQSQLDALPAKRAWFELPRR
jgi:O-succinylbenzoate synthase